MIAKFLPTLFIFTASCLLNEAVAADDNDAVKQKLTGPEMVKKTKELNTRVRYIVKYTLLGDDNVQTTSPMTQQELTEFLLNTDGKLLVGVATDKPILDSVLDDASDAASVNKFIVRYKIKGSEEENQTMPLTQSQLQSFLDVNENVLVVGIDNTNPIHPPLTDDDSLQGFRRSTD